jgi:hypothetical protein
MVLYKNSKKKRTQPNQKNPKKEETRVPSEKRNKSDTITAQ